MTRYFIRHDNLLTITQAVEDPAYLTEPFILSRTWELDPKANFSSTPYPCTPGAELPRLIGDGTVPHLLPGKNPFVGELTKLYNIPEETILGGAETMYPEYRKRLRDTYVPPEKCIRYCCGWENGAPTSSIQCIGVGYATPEQPFGRKL